MLLNYHNMTGNTRGPLVMKQISYNDMSVCNFKYFVLMFKFKFTTSGLGLVGRSRWHMTSTSAGGTFEICCKVIIT